MLRPAIFWLCLLFDPPNVYADRHISIVLTPRGYKDPRTLANFTCGVDKATDAGRLLAEQNTNYIFETFLDNKESNPKYQTKVFDVLAFSKDGTAEDMIKNQPCAPDMEESGLYSLFLSPPKAQCNRRTFEDALEASGVGYYPIYFGTTGNFSEMISKFTSGYDNFKPFYNGDVPKLFGTKLKMRPEPANARKNTILQMFNVLYNSATARNLVSTHEKSCWSSNETVHAMSKGDLFDISPNAKFVKRNSIVAESDGYAQVKIEREATDRKSVAFVKTKFSAPGGELKPADAKDIVEFNWPVIFNEGSISSNVFIRVKSDNEEEGPESFDVILQDVAALKKSTRVKRSEKNVRVKRMVRRPVQAVNKQCLWDRVNEYMEEKLWQMIYRINPTQTVNKEAQKAMIGKIMRKLKKMFDGSDGNAFNYGGQTYPITGSVGGEERVLGEEEVKRQVIHRGECVDGDCSLNGESRIQCSPAIMGPKITVIIIQGDWQNVFEPIMNHLTPLLEANLRTFDIGIEEVLRVLQAYNDYKVANPTSDINCGSPIPGEAQGSGGSASSIRIGPFPNLKAMTEPTKAGSKEQFTILEEYTQERMNKLGAGMGRLVVQDRSNTASTTSGVGTSVNWNSLHCHFFFEGIRV